MLLLAEGQKSIKAVAWRYATPIIAVGALPKSSDARTALCVTPLGVVITSSLAFTAAHTGNTLDCNWKLEMLRVPYPLQPGGSKLTMDVPQPIWIALTPSPSAGGRSYEGRSLRFSGRPLMCLSCTRHSQIQDGPRCSCKAVYPLLQTCLFSVRQVFRMCRIRSGKVNTQTRSYSLFGGYLANKSAWVGAIDIWRRPWMDFVLWIRSSTPGRFRRLWSWSGR